MFVEHVYHLMMCDMKYSTFILPIIINLDQIYHYTIIIMICISLPVWMIVEPQKTQKIWLEYKLTKTVHKKTLVNGPK